MRKNRMKTIMSAILATVMMMSITACSNTNETVTNEVENEPTLDVTANVVCDEVEENLNEEKEAVYNLTGFENEEIEIKRIAQYISGISNKEGGVTEIVSYDIINKKAWVVNGEKGVIEILDLSTLATGESEIKAESKNLAEIVELEYEGFEYGDTTSVSINSEKGLVAVAMQDLQYNNNGCVAFFDTDGNFVAVIEAGVQPDMVTFTPDSKKVLVANEGEPREGIGEGVTDPQGSVTVIDVNYKDVKSSTAENVGFAEFDNMRNELVEDGVILVKDAKPSEDLEPEFIACDDKNAYVVLQESNAVAILDLASKTYTGIYSLGYKDLSAKENAIDLLQDETYLAKTYPNVMSAYMPDGITVYKYNGETYLLVANEGDSKEWGAGETAYVNEKTELLMADDGTEAEGVTVIDATVTDGLPEGKTVMYGGRSFSIYKATAEGLEQIFDSANEFEQKTAQYLFPYFNCSRDSNDIDCRSTEKGPEPESVVIGQVGDKTYAFVTLEPIGGFMVYDITNPQNTKYSDYMNSRNFSENPETDVLLYGDNSPEGLYFVNEKDSVTGQPLLIAACEVSGTVAVYEMKAKE